MQILLFPSSTIATVLWKIVWAHSVACTHVLLLFIIICPSLMKATQTAPIDLSRFFMTTTQLCGTLFCLCCLDDDMSVFHITIGSVVQVENQDMNDVGGGGSQLFTRMKEQFPKSESLFVANHSISPCSSPPLKEHSWQVIGKNGCPEWNWSREHLWLDQRKPLHKEDGSLALEDFWQGASKAPARKLHWKCCMTGTTTTTWRSKAAWSHELSDQYLHLHQLPAKELSLIVGRLSGCIGPWSKNRVSHFAKRSTCGKLSAAQQEEPKNAEVWKRARTSCFDLVNSAGRT